MTSAMKENMVMKPDSIAMYVTDDPPDTTSLLRKRSAKPTADIPKIARNTSFLKKASSVEKQEATIYRYAELCSLN